MQPRRQLARLNIGHRDDCRGDSDQAETTTLENNGASSTTTHSICNVSASLLLQPSIGAFAKGWGRALSGLQGNRMRGLARASVFPPRSTFSKAISVYAVGHTTNPLISSPRSCDDYHVAWVCPLADVELLPARLMLDEEHPTPPYDTHYDENTYICGTINGHAVVIATYLP
ncbi:hypothetical protein K458DRAFT_394281 [Lentithecium fluviatile CBS 122367]|uniref:Uncharacterized protein n=1 Tax=Lentithecium fluviatile CBS 122367 TaxID=1168545 RepID=A0A6G1IMF8_9PLEO|nr:hypothetical protein K458DRAFT_394281 [Lentithecium fluviatile CBS 122367]